MYVKDVGDFKVYQRALKALLKLYKLVQHIPKYNIKLKVQCISSGESIAPLMAEGFGRKKNTKDFKHFIRMAMSSSDETITHLRQIYLLSRMHASINQELCIELGKEYKIISKQLNKLIREWKS